MTVPRDTVLDGGVGLIQRIENRVSGILTILARAREDLTAAKETITETEQRIGQAFRHIDALAQAEEDLARIETRLAAMQSDVAEPEQPGDELTVQAVRDYRPALGVRPSAPRQVPDDELRRHDDDRVVDKTPRFGL